MMQDQHKLSLNYFYKRSIDKARRCLESKYALQICSKDNEDYPNNISSDSWIAWKIRVENDLHPLTLVVAIPKTFPDRLPKIYLSKRNYLEIMPIPHVDKNKFVCTRDPNVVFLNDEKPGEAIVELVEIATEIINQGVKKENLSDFTEEFLAYWNEDADTKALSLFPLTDNIEKLKAIKLSKKFLESQHIIVRTKSEAEKWLEPLSLEIVEDGIRETLYMPLSQPISSSAIPQKSVDIVYIARKAGQKHTRAVENFFARNEIGLILLSFPLKGERILIGFWMGVPKNTTSFKGFRPGKVPLEIRMARSRGVAEVSIEKVDIVRVDKKRLLKRGGTSIELFEENASVAIIGCGSLGSVLAMSLLKCGLSKFLLVDNELVAPENVARHLCGFSEAGCFKSKAVQDRLLKHFPHIECEEYHEDILILLQEKETLLNTYDLVIISVGNQAVERRLNHLLRKGIVTSPLLYLWLEPFGAAGQILYIHPSEGGCYRCCFNCDGNFLFSVAKPSEKAEFYQRESGCQSTFLPYSSLEIEKFVGVASKKVIDFFGNKSNCSILYTWLGDITAFESLGYQIQKKWMADSSYTIHERKILKMGDCGICKSP